MSDRPLPLMIVYRISPIIAAAILSLMPPPNWIVGASFKEFSTFSAVFMWLKTCIQETHSSPPAMPSTKT